MLAIVLCCLFALAGPLPSPTAELELVPNRFTAQITSGAMTKGEAAGVVDASVDAVLFVLQDCEAASRWFPGLSETRSRVRDEREICSGRAGRTGPTWTVQTDVMREDQTWIVPFMGLASDGVHQLYGGFHLARWDEDPERTVVVLELWVELEEAPRPAAVRRAQRRLQDALAGLESQARGEDLSRAASDGPGWARARARSRADAGFPR